MKLSKQSYNINIYILDMVVFCHYEKKYLFLIAQNWLRNDLEIHTYFLHKKVTAILR